MNARDFDDLGLKAAILQNLFEVDNSVLIFFLFL